jgi:PAS domain S-box-containing protein
MGALLLACVGLEYYCHTICGITKVYAHLFYIPIIIAALWWGLNGALSVGLFLGIMHAYSYLPGGDEASLWRALIFVFIGCVIGTICERRKRVEATLREAERKFQDIVLSSADWIWEVDKDGRYTFVSGRVKEILGYEPDDLLGKTPFELMPDEEAKRISEVFGKIALDKKPIIDLENWNLTRQGDRVCLLTNGVPVFDNSGELTGYRGVDKDITERKQAEERRFACRLES